MDEVMSKLRIDTALLEKMYSDDEIVRRIREDEEMLDRY
jgi:hypothetical protein